MDSTMDTTIVDPLNGLLAKHRKTHAEANSSGKDYGDCWWPAVVFVIFSSNGTKTGKKGK